MKFNISIFILVVSFLSCTETTTDKTPLATHPGPRWGHLFVYHPAQNHILLYGGIRKQGDAYLNDTWIWKDSSWKKMDVPSPPARGFCAAAYHAERKSIILHGGRGNERQTYSDLWEWDGMTWTMLEEESPVKVDHHQMVYLEDQKALFTFGGWDGKEVMGKTWMWSGTWEKQADPSPPKRSAFSMVYHPADSSVRLYGGLWINGQYADMWAWQDKQWTALSGPYDNSSLDHHAMIYDEKRGQIIGFGGKNYRYVAQHNTFQLTDSTVEVISQLGPSGRHSIGFTYDSQAQLGYLYGGKAYVNGEQEALDDFWKWDGENWEKLNDNPGKRED